MKELADSGAMVRFREAKFGDLPGIVKILNDIILEGDMTADMSPYSVDEKQSWLESLSKPPYFVHVLEVDGIIAGYVYISPWRNGRAALQHVAEISYFLAMAFRGAGYGRKLLLRGLQSAKEGGIKTLLAILLDSNTTSTQLLESEGFHIAGHLPLVAELNDRVAGQFIMMKNINP